jgi:hypothetical protein
VEAMSSLQYITAIKKLVDFVEEVGENHFNQKTLFFKEYHFAMQFETKYQVELSNNTWH